MAEKMQELQEPSAGATSTVQWDLNKALYDQMDSVTWVSLYHCLIIEVVVAVS